MTTRDDLVSRLRTLAADTTLKCWEPRHGDWMQAMREAASALEAKDAEIARQSAEATSYHGFWIGERDKRIAAESRITSLERQLAEETERCAQIVLSSVNSKNLADRSPKHIASAIRGGAK